MNLLQWLSNLVEGAVLRGFHSALKKLGIDPAEEATTDPLAAAFEKRVLAEASTTPARTDGPTAETGSRSRRGRAQ